MRRTPSPDPPTNPSRTGAAARRSGVVRRGREALLRLLKQGLSPGALAAAVAVGLALGVFPLLGTTTLLSAGVALALGLNQPAVQAANYLAYPLQLVLLVPFLRLGEWLFGAPRAPMALEALLHGLKSDFGATVGTFWTALWHACVAWVLVAPFGAALLAVMLRPAFRAAARRFGREAKGEATP